MIRFYSPDIESAGNLPVQESGHCIRVLRHRVGDEIDVVDGKGCVYHCRITDADPRCVGVEVMAKQAEPSHWHRRITLAVAPTKNADRMEWLAEKVTEMGIDRLVLLRCEHSERKAMKTDRLQRVMLSAMKQSLKATLPDLIGPVSFAEFLESVKKEDCKWIAHCEEDKPRESLLNHLPRQQQDIVILIGPEGDFSPSEIEEALQKGFTPVTMGRSRLRTETAALFAVAALHAASCEDFACKNNDV